MNELEHDLLIDLVIRSEAAAKNTHKAKDNNWVMVNYITTLLNNHFDYVIPNFVVTENVDAEKTIRSYKNYFLMIANCARTRLTNESVRPNMPFGKEFKEVTA